jgi:hypothetical protein
MRNVISLVSFQFLPFIPRVPNMSDHVPPWDRNAFRVQHNGRRKNTERPEICAVREETHYGYYFVAGGRFSFEGKHKNIMKIQLGLVALTMLCALPADANMILNGGFENPSPASPYQYRTGNQISDWTISSSYRGVVQFDSSYQPVGGPNYSVQLESGGSSPDSISQTVATVQGATYYVSFLLAAWNGNATSMKVTIDNFAQIYTSNSQTYSPYSFSFVADNTSATLKFENAGPYAVSYPQIDSVSMVPELTTVIAGALLMLPFGASTLRILRKRQTA